MGAVHTDTGALRILFTLHHRLNPNAGAPGVTLALGDALERAGCRVEYFGYHEAFPRRGPESGESVGSQLAFPMRVAAHLFARARQFDLVDASTGDAWLWTVAGGHRRGGPALVTRAHGLEHVADERKRRAASGAGPPLSRRYPLYHGGLRLWEVKRSIRASDHCVLLNGGDRDYVRDRLGVPADRVSVVPNGIPDHMLHATDVAPRPAGPIRLAFIGRWTTYKGRHTLVEAIERLERRGVAYELTIFGVGEGTGALDHFSPAARERVSIVPRFANRDLPQLLADHDVFVFPTLSEGSSVSLMEAMACGLAPVATAVGAAPEVIEQGRNGFLVEVDDAAGMADALARLAADKAELDAIRARAQATGRGFGWEAIAERTLALYRSVLAARSA